MMSHDDCDHVQRLISEGLDRPLTASETTTVRSHLAGCAACATFERALRAGTTEMAGLPRFTLNPRVRETMMDEIERGSFGRPRGAGGWLRQGLQIAGSGAAFALVALLLITVIGSGSGGDPGEQRGGAGGFGTSAEPTPTTAESVPVIPDGTTPANEETVIAPCVPGQYELTLNTMDVASNTGTITIIAVTAIKTSGGAYCLLTEDVTLTLVDAEGQPLPVEANPLTRTIDGAVPSEEPGFALAWLNWCGEPVEVALRAENGSSASEQGPVPLPTCDDTSQPSKLGDAANIDLGALAFPVDPACFTSSGPEQRDSDVVRFVWALSTDPECLNADGSVEFSLRDSNGELLPVENNPLRLIPRPLEGVDGVGLIGVEWTNWCGGAGNYSVEALYGGAGAGMSLQDLPPCVTGEPSQLIELANPADYASEEDFGPLPPQVKPVPAEPMLPACDPATAELGMETQSLDDTLMIYVKASDANGACSIQSDFSVEITDAAGEPLDIEPNPLVEPPSNEPLKEDAVIGGATWQNWCGAGDAVTVTASLGNGLASETVSGLPRCADAGQPSTLSAFWTVSSVSELVTEDASGSEPGSELDMVKPTPTK